VAAVRSTNNHRPVGTTTNKHRAVSPVPSTTKAPRPSTSTIGSDHQSGDYRGITFEDILPSHLITNAPPPTIEQRQKRGSVRLSKAPPAPAAERHNSAPVPVKDRSPPSMKRSYPTVKRSGENKSRLRSTMHTLMRSFTFAKREGRGRTAGYERY
jgi:hypothetical protein